MNAPGSYTDSVPAAKEYYPSRYGYQDEVAWAAAWLYSATGEKRYLHDAASIYQSAIQGRLTGAASCWDDKRPALAVLMARITRQDVYKKDAEHFWTTGRTGGSAPGCDTRRADWPGTTNGGRSATQQMRRSSLLCTATGGGLPLMYHRFAKRQINYILGDNPRNGATSLALETIRR